ncbi:Hypothetical predicted protein [Paramuricea clavata]|uniref:Uncharacterized protein n=1 Tax=Paramuricea clavata TaxID=317549 RepID=A0A6S7GTJ2_PARCT|nr:Hypothetical predicted protein [Paramuricea clavata]
MKRTARGELKSEEPIEEHDSGFIGPMTLFDTFPYNDTFEETRELNIVCSPPTATAETYTFIHNRQDYGVIRTEDIFLKANIKLKTGNAYVANDREVSLNMAPLRFGWKSEEVYINNQLVSVQSSKENELAYFHWLLTAVPSNYKDEEKITFMIRDTPGHFDDIDGIADGTGVNNLGMRKRKLLCTHNTPFECIDRIDLLGYNKRFIPISLDFKIVLTRLEKTKLLLGDATYCAAAEIPIIKPNAQLSAAINELMIQKGEECRFYRTTHRYVAFPIPVGARVITHRNIFNGSRPGRTVTKIVPQTVYNGAHTLNPFKIPYPTITYHAISVNEAIVPPVYRTSKESYMTLRQILDRRYSEMPFTYDEYVSDYGIIVNDLSPNKDGFDQVLPNVTSGNVSIEVHFRVDTTTAQQLIIMGEFRNQLSVDYMTAARNKVDV